jgi:excisionase family DNA binding protein
MIETNERLRFNTTQAADHAGCHPDTVRRALESGGLHGHQRVAGGRWLIRRECLESWMDGERCSHQAAV